VATAVSPELFERFREGIECWNRDELDQMADMYAEDARFDVSAVFSDTAPMRGRRELIRYWTELRETWAGLRQDPIEAWALGDERYVVELRMSGKGSRSGAEVDQRFAMLYVFDETGKVASASLFPDVAAATSAAETSANQA
jgi:ketosteroid isomerase-like protein